MKRRTTWRRWQATVDFVTSLVMLGATAVLIWQYWPKNAVPDLPVPEETLEIRDTAVIGSTDAEMIVLVFTDFQCPYCARFALGGARDIKLSHINTGRTQMVVRHFPLSEIHPTALIASVAAECAGQQSEFGAFHDLLFEQQAVLPELAASNFAAAVSELRLDAEMFQQCLVSQEAVSRVQLDAAEGRRLGISATPTIMIGRRVEGNKVRLMKRVSGPLTASALERQIEEAAGNDPLRDKRFDSVMVASGLGIVMTVLGVIAWRSISKNRLRRLSAATVGDQTDDSRSRSPRI